MDSTKEIKIFDTTLRDGEQVPGCKLDGKQKLLIAEALEHLGVNVIEAGFAISSPGDFKAITEISKLIKKTSVCALSRAVKKDIEAAADSLIYAKFPRIHTGIGTSDSHIKHKFNSTRDKVLERAVAAVKYAKSFVEDVEFYAEDAGRTSNEFLAAVCEAVIKAGATVLNIPDTTGYCLPSEYGAKMKYLKENVKGIDGVTLSCHCHNDLGLATANALEGVINGARQVECTINGLGERAGNTSLEEITMILQKHKHLGFTTSIQNQLLCQTSDLVAETMQMFVAPNKAIVGSNAFSHSSGIHQDGVIKKRSTYEIIDPLEVGRDTSKIILTARSGRAALAFKARNIGIELTKAELDKVYSEFLTLADVKKEIDNDDIVMMVERSLKKSIKMAGTIFDKIWNKHVVEKIDEETEIIYVDTHLIHEVTSPQAFQQIEEKGLKVFRPQQTYATADHNVPTIDQHLPIKDLLSAGQVKKLISNCDKHGIELFGLGHPNQGIVHVMAPELGITLPGNVLVCGDSHTSTHGAFGAIAFGIGTSQVAQVFASQCLLLAKPKKMRIIVNGKLSKNVLAKDVILYIISKLGTDAGTGYFVEFAGEVFEQMSMEERMTVCNMSIEMGARGGLIAPDKTTFNYINGREYAPSGEALDQKMEEWKKLKSENNAVFDMEYKFDAGDIAPMLTYGTNPSMAIKLNESIPDINDTTFEKALDYMGFSKNESLKNKVIDYVFIGSCTNSRIEDFRIVADFIKGKKKAKNIEAIIVPGSQHVSKQIVKEGLDLIFKEADMLIRQPGCSACLGMNDDKIPEGKYCVSTSNRNFEGRQGKGARTILASPLTAAAAAIEGKIVDISHYN